MRVLSDGAKEQISDADFRERVQKALDERDKDKSREQSSNEIRVAIPKKK